MSFTFRYLKPTDPYYPNWADRRRRVRLAWGGVAASMVVFAVLATAVEIIFGRGGWTFWLAVVPTITLFYSGWIYLGLWRCPRCGGSFYTRLKPFANYCVQCG